MANGAEERITRLETAFEATLPHLATKTDISRLETAFESTLPHLATKADISRLETAFESTLPHLATKADISKLESKMVLGALTILLGLTAIIVRLFT
ncbi:MAG: hypothetical protein OXF11_07760 [Deltaproteobacteria bacterium]|nr:hypothetical protein [Deltaproteobacteria bacterium]